MLAFSYSSGGSRRERWTAMHCGSGVPLRAMPEPERWSTRPRPLATRLVNGALELVRTPLRSMAYATHSAPKIGALVQQSSGTRHPEHTSALHEDCEMRTARSSGSRGPRLAPIVPVRRSATASAYLPLFQILTKTTTPPEHARRRVRMGSRGARYLYSEHRRPQRRANMSKMHTGCNVARQQGQSSRMPTSVPSGQRVVAVGGVGTATPPWRIDCEGHG